MTTRDVLKTREEKDTSVGGQPSGAASTARTEILTALATAGYTATAAAQLLAHADLEPRADSTEFPATLGGGHALVVEYGDEEMYGWCQCGKPLGTLRPDKPIGRFAGPWARHVMTEVA